MSEAVQTLDGWYALHDFRSIDWTLWKSLSPEEQRKAEDSLRSYIASCATADEQKTGSFAFYSIVGQKADFVFVHLRETLEELNELETAFNKTLFADVTLPAYSYVSVVELSSYLAGDSDSDPMQNPHVVARLKPSLPKTKYICFYPMNKRRIGDENWYMLPMDKRRELMRSHGAIGRSYAGKVKQIITGSIGLDEWEWGVTLFADDALQFKKLVYEMRFDEVSAKYGEFGDFYVGVLTDADKFIATLA